MLRIGLTGGIGAGKSTVSATFDECGAVIVDGDVIAREVVEPGTEGLAALVEAFGSEILLPDGRLDRPALAKAAFSDEHKRATLNGIVHPLVARRRAGLIAAAADDAVIVEDIPLLVESQMAALFPLVVVVHADIETRVVRLVRHRGLSEADARARIAAQATEEQRRAVADVWLDNSGSQDQLVASARRLWHQRIVPFAHNIQARRIVQPAPRLAPADPTWAEQADRIVARIKTACGHRALRVDHIGQTAVPGLAARGNEVGIQVTVPSLESADEIAAALLAVGYPRAEDNITDPPRAYARSTVTEFDHTDDSTLWQKRFHGSADPGRPTSVDVRVDGWPGQQFALLFVDWLIANPEVLSVVKDAVEGPDGRPPWDLDAYRRAWEWADSTGWRP
jgi:dephospho-CoA kinase